MDKATKTQFSIGFFIIGIIMLFIPDLRHLDAIPLGISPYFNIMFYLGLLCVGIGYYLK
jgi:drug/metabolite transporter (DMT)-like permease